MKFFIGTVLFITLLFSYDGAIAQRRRMPDEERGPGPERLERFKKMRLIEVLKLNEEESVRFFAKQSAHEDKIHELMKTRNEMLDDLQGIVKEKGDAKELQKLSDQVLGIDLKVFTERQRFQDEVRKSLTPEQFATFLIFERNFGRQVRDAMDEMRRRSGRGEEE